MAHSCSNPALLCLYLANTCKQVSSLGTHQRLACTLSACRRQHGQLHACLHSACRRLVDIKPHQPFGTEQHNMLEQFAELVVKEIEKEKVGAAVGGRSVQQGC